MKKSPNPLAIKALEIVEDQLKEFEEKAILKVLRAIHEGRFTEELAMQKWHEIYALRLVPSKLKRQARVAAKQADAKPVDKL